MVPDPTPLFLDLVGREVLHRPWGAASERTVAHRGHSVTGAAAVEGSPERGLEGQDILPLVPAAPAPGGLHQVGAAPPPPTSQSLRFPEQTAPEGEPGTQAPRKEVGGGHPAQTDHLDSRATLGGRRTFCGGGLGTRPVCPSDPCEARLTLIRPPVWSLWTLYHHLPQHFMLQ